MSTNLISATPSTPLALEVYDGSPAAATPPPSKEVILDAAQRLLARHGYAGLSMRELAAESGLAKATIYHHFQDKDALFHAVLERDMASVHAQLAAAAAEATDAVAKISAVIRVYVALMRERRTVIMSVLHEMSRETSDLTTFIYERRTHYFASITAILEEGIAGGHFRPLNVELATLALIGMINSFMVFTCHEDPQRSGAPQADDDQFIEQTIALFLSGILPQR